MYKKAKTINYVKLIFGHLTIFILYHRFSHINYIPKHLKHKKK